MPEIFVTGGDCEVVYDDYACVRSANYPMAYTNDVECTITFSAPSVYLTASDPFSTESGYDYLYVNGDPYNTAGTATVQGSSWTYTDAVSSLWWTSDFYLTNTGWELCVTSW
jgi:hypothetical protein